MTKTDRTGPWPLAICAAILLSACGGGGGSGEVQAPAADISGESASIPPEAVDGVQGSAVVFANTTSGQLSSLRYVSVSTELTGLDQNTGALDHDAGRITGGLFAGAINQGRTLVDLDEGGTATLQNLSNTDYVRVFQLQGSDFDQFGTGVVGVQTAPTSSALATGIGTGSSIYNGDVRLQATDTTDTYAVSGAAEVNVSFENSNANISFTGLTGRGNADPATIDAGTLTISGANLNGAAFVGGRATGTGSLFSGLNDDTESSGTRGEFFGPDADEVGGTVAIDTNSLEVVGVYTAKSP
ncbi:transferrin-binding protein-like solute binding protein [Yoonia sediminilitoris]|uniref:Transferrin-binding protein B C-lobe/N-lobe beta-barrel domain-containing protein n=1 Tax=Yoonia sediminilitoris TaxID=1286148 RepID=A0A2T6KID7_9RHOB|nr:transferrin-binding protein-like solute binding protein [Yoonia sediminilitoris]PUB15496.1 hypothetical protein C8N45_104116 [Yoonia sediminilitoris]RCW96106.1 hypothetical protein DFP92_104116 [Yoonia sediminilitoris]